MGYYLKDRSLGDTPEQAAKNLLPSEKKKMLLDFIADWMPPVEEKVASGAIYDWTYNDLVVQGLERIQRVGVSYGRVKWRDESAPAKKTSTSKTSAKKPKVSANSKAKGRR